MHTTGHLGLQYHHFSLMQDRFWVSEPSNPVSQTSYVVDIVFIRFAFIIRGLPFRFFALSTAREGTLMTILADICGDGVERRRTERQVRERHRWTH